MRNIPAAWTAAIHEWERWARVSGYPKTTIGTRRQHLQHMARGLGVASPWEVSKGDLLEWWGQQTWENETRRGRRTTVRHFYRWALEEGHTATSPAVVLPRVQPGRPNPRPTPAAVYSRAKLVATRRELLMLRMANEGGLRRAEVAQGHARDLIEDLAGWSLVVHGKGGKQRVVPLMDDLAAELRALGPGYFFPGRDNGHLSARWVGKLITRLMDEGWTMHTLRHAFATRARDEGVDLFELQEILGHASVDTTRRYVFNSHERLRNAVRKANRAA